MTQHYTLEKFNKLKDSIMQKLVLHMLDPKHFGINKITLDEIAILIAPNYESVPSKMMVWKLLNSAKNEMKTYLYSIGIDSIDDYLIGYSPGPNATYGSID